MRGKKTVNKNEITFLKGKLIGNRKWKISDNDIFVWIFVYKMMQKEKKACKVS